METSDPPINNPPEASATKMGPGWVPFVVLSCEVGQGKQISKRGFYPC